MTHREENVRVHHPGDAHDLRITVEDTDGNPVDLTGSSIEWLLKEDSHDTDSDALLTKSGDEGGTSSDVTFNDTANGIVTIHIQTDETSSLVDWTSYTADSKTFFHVIRVTDSNNNRSTGFTGNFTVYPS